MTAYEVLGVTPNDSLEYIKIRYIALVKKYHPDINRSNLATEKLKTINAAWDAINKPSKQNTFKETKPHSEAKPSPSTTKRYVYYEVDLTPYEAVNGFVRNLENHGWVSFKAACNDDFFTIETNTKIIRVTAKLRNTKEFRFVGRNIYVSVTLPKSKLKRGMNVVFPFPNTRGQAYHTLGRDIKENTDLLLEGGIEQTKGKGNTILTIRVKKNIFGF